MAVVRLNNKVIVWFSVAQTIEENDAQTPDLPQVDTEALNETD